jgi:methyl-accepting chemotaxis protein
MQPLRLPELAKWGAVLPSSPTKYGNWQNGVNVATQEINDNIGGMISLVQDTQSENETINADIRQTRAVVERSSTEFSRMVGDFERTGDQLDQIATAIEQLTATNAQVHEAVRQVNDLSKEVSVTMKSSEQSTIQLGVATESVQELVSRFKIGRGTFDQNVDVVRNFRDALQDKLVAMQARGINVFDQNYQAVHGTKPQKYSVSYEQAYMAECQSLLDDALANMKGGAYAVGVDTNGYLTAHNRKYSKPLTGNYQADLVGNRTCRNLRRQRNCAPLAIPRPCCCRLISAIPVSYFATSRCLSMSAESIGAMSAPVVTARFFSIPR